MLKSCFRTFAQATTGNWGLEIIVGEVVPFRKPGVSGRFKGRSLCKSGFHKWIIVQDQRFDVKQGKLVTLSQCRRCGKVKIELI